jgi:uncharacterized protein YndB with AHSA1/START domain
MTARSAQHGTLRLERRFAAPPARVFAAWADPVARAKWDVPGRWTIAGQTHDFREGGREIKRFGPPDDPRFVADTLYLDIVPQHRIVFSYSMTSRDVPVSVSLTTVELSPARKATRLTLIEQIVLLDGNDTLANREEGLASMLEKIGAMVSASDSN